MNQKNFNLYVIDVECNPKIAYYFESMRKERDKRIAHLLSLSFPQYNMALKPDTLVYNPEDSLFSERVPVVGIIESMRWNGNIGDNIELYGGFSFQNKAIMQEVFMLAENPIIEATWVIYDFDFTENKYFKRFFTGKQPLKLLIAKNSSVYISENPDYGITDPVNFRFGLSLSPFHACGPQKVYIAYSATGTVLTREIISNDECNGISSDNQVRIVDQSRVEPKDPISF